MSLSRGLVRLLAAACAVTIANVYYAQPLLHTIAQGFGASQSAAGLAVTATQGGFAAGLLLIVPLGDITARRPLFTTLLVADAAALAASAAAPTLPVLGALVSSNGAGRFPRPADAERAARQAHLQQAEADFEPLPFDAGAARAFGQVAASLRRAGRKPAARSYDAMIAATALSQQLPVYTCNPDDFGKIGGLEVVPIAVPPLA